MTIHPTLYTIDSKGKVRTWAMEREGDRYRTISGLEDGAKTTSGWTTASPKNVGRSNATTAEEQAELEIQAEYRKKRDRKYHDDRSKVGGAKFFAPMLAQTFKGWDKLGDIMALSQPKLDGIRCIATVDGLFTRQGKRIVTCPHIELQLNAAFGGMSRGTILDGELYNHELREDFNTIASLVRQAKPTAEDLKRSAEMVQYHIYDHASKLEQPLGWRMRNLAGWSSERFSFEVTPSLRIVPTEQANSSQQLDSLYASYLEQGYEGQMVRLNGPYEAGKRSKLLLKRKEFQDAEFPVVRLEEGNGNWAGYAKRAVLRLPDGREFGAGIKGSQEFTKALLSKPTPKTATIRYFALTPDGIPRFPVAVAFFEGERDI